MRDFLKQNLWDFSVAKNYNEVIALNNLLVKEDGTLRQWSDFKREAQKVVGTSIRHLRTEYNTIVASSQMNRLWQEIQRDKHIFPFLQFDVVEDKHTSNICRPLDGVIVSVDDPMLLQYFPPNHFNCRTTVRKLRKGAPSQNYQLPQLQKAFLHNVGVSKTIFSGDNRYIQNTPEKIKVLAYKSYRKTLIQEAKEILKGKTVYREELKGNIKFSSKGIQEAINIPMDEKLYKIKNEMVKDMPYILKNATYLGFSTYKQEATVKGAHIYEIKVGDNILYAVVKEYINGEFIFYSLSDKPNIIKGIEKQKSHQEPSTLGN